MNISRWIYWWADRMPDQVAVRFDGSEITYSAFAEDVNRAACTLQELGVGKGHRVAWLGFNGPAFLAGFFACARIGAVMVPLNFRLAAREHLFILKTRVPGSSSVTRGWLRPPRSSKANCPAAG